MFVKLSFRNICRSSRDYSIFITTLTFSISMIFAYNSLIYNENIAQIGVQMDFMMKLIQAISLILVFMLSWLISYIIKFMFEKRGKEFAIYLTMGMNKTQLVHLFFWEQMILGLLATILGILIGQFIYFTFCQIIYHVLEVSAHPPFVFHRAAFTLTIVYFVIMYAFAILRQVFVLKKISVKSLLYLEQKNEEVLEKKAKHSLLSIILLTILAVLGFFLIFKSFEFDTIWETQNTIYLFSGIIIQILSILLFYRASLSSFLFYFQKKKKLKYHNLNVFLYRQITSKLHTNGKHIGILAILLLLSMLSMGSSLILYSNCDNEISRTAPFHIMISGKSILEWKEVENILQADENITEQLMFTTYQDNDASFLKSHINIDSNISYQYPDRFIRLSDYNAIRTMKGFDALHISNNQFIVHCSNEKIINNFTIGMDSLKINSRSLQLVDVLDDSFGLYGFIGYDAILVVPDELCSSLENVQQSFIGNIKNKLHSDTISKLESIDSEHLFVQLKDVLTTEMKSVYLMLSFASAYTAMITIFIAGTIISVQQLNEGTKNKHYYDVLRELGTEIKDVKRIIFNQIMIYFILPFILPILYGAVYLYALYRSHLLPSNLVLMCAVLTVLLIFIFYCSYFLITYHEYQKHVLHGGTSYNIHDLLES